MLPPAMLERLPPALARRLTPRRQRAGLIAFTVFILYSLFGFLAVPGIVQQQAERFVHEELKLDFQAGRVEFNPWRLALRIDALKVAEPGGETLLAARSFYINVALWHSAWLRGASLDELDLLEPYINARLRQDGSLNLLQLLPPEDPEADESSVTWRIGQLGIHRARIDLHDDSRPTPFSTVFSPLNLALNEISSRPDKDGKYNLRAETGEGEVLEWEGTLALQPVRSQGRLAISGLRATTPWRYLQDELPVVVSDGLIAIRGDYELLVDEAAEFRLSAGEVTVDALALQQKLERPLAVRLERIALTGVTLEWPAQKAGFGELALTGFRLQDGIDGAALAGFGDLRFTGGRYQPDPEQASLASIRLDALRLADGAGQPALLALPRLQLDNLEARPATPALTLGRITLADGALSVIREADGQLNWARLEALIARLQQGLPADDSGIEAPAWQLSLGELALDGFRVAATDRVPQPVVNTGLENIRLRLLPRQPGEERHRLDAALNVTTGGELALAGSFSEAPLAVDARLDLKGLALPAFASYALEHVRMGLESGSVDAAGKLGFRDGKTVQASFDGRVAINRFAANDLDEDERFLAWNRLALEGLRWQLAPERLSIREIVAEKPFARVIIGSDASLNIARILDIDDGATDEAATTKTAAAPSTSAAPYPLRIDRVRVSNGALLFADLSLRPQFATGIEALNGDIRGLSTAPGSRADITLEGRVDEYGRADIRGQVSPFADDLYTDIGLKFQNLELTTLTPYSSKFAGYQIDKGKLSMDLRYRIEERKLRAENKVVLDQLTLGEKVDSPDAMSLPVKLALAILKDRNGVIDIDLPVSGSLDDPQFRVGPLIWKAFVNLVTKAATAPFSMLAGLVSGGDQLDTLLFTPGQGAVTESEAAKLAQLARALAERPALAVELRGTFDPAADLRALRQVKFDADYRKRHADGERTQRRLEALYREKLGSEALARQRALSLRPDATGQDLKLAEGLYLKALEEELAAREVVVDSELRTLALERARQVRSRLVEAGGIAEGRVFVLEPVNSTAQDGQVPMKIALTAS